MCDRKQTAYLGGLQEGIWSIPNCSYRLHHCDVSYKYIIMLLKGKVAELLVQVDPSLYRKYVITNSK